MDNWYATTKSPSQEDIEEKKRLEDIVSKSLETYTNMLNDESYLDDIALDVEELEAEKKEKIASVTSTSTNEGDNEYIKTFLLLIFHAILKKDVYPDWLYLLVIIMISVTIAGLLEAVIYITQALITTSTEDLTKIFEADKQTHDAIKEKTDKILHIIIRSVIPFSIFIIFGLLREVTMNTFNLIAGLVCCIATVLIAVFIPNKPYEPKRTPVKKVEKVEDSLLKFITTEGKSILIKGVISASLFIVLGIFYQKEIAELSLPALSVAIGQIIGHFLKIEPKTVTII